VGDEGVASMSFESEPIAPLTILNAEKDAFATAVNLVGFTALPDVSRDKAASRAEYHGT